MKEKAITIENTSMLDRRLSYRYFENFNSDINNLLQSVNCLVRWGYVLYGFLFNEHPSYPAIGFLTDITPYVITTREDSIKLITFRDLTLNTELYKTEVYNGEWDKGILELESLLNAGEIIFLQAEVYKLPFHIEYSGEAFFSHHRFPVIGHDSEYFYYVEPPWELNDKYVPHQDNDTVGMIKKNELRDILGSQLYFIRTIVKNNGKYDERKWFRNMLERTVGTYEYKFNTIKEIGHNHFTKDFIIDFHEKRVLCDGEEWSYDFGKSAIEKLIEIICVKKTPLNNLFNPCPKENLLFWYKIIMGRILGKRFVLSNAMKEYSKLTNTTIPDKFSSAIDSSIKTWEIIIAIIMKKVMTKNYQIDSMLEKRILSLREIEKNLIYEISNFLAYTLYR